MKQPKVFISYSWDSDEHKAWVRHLAECLHANSVHVYLDQWDVSLGDDLPRFMESAVRESDFVLLVCTPHFAAKADAGKGGVGYEKSIVTGEIFSDSSQACKFVALLRCGDALDALPSYLKSKAFIDFRYDNVFPTQLEEVLRHIYRVPRFKRPTSGTIPAFVREAHNAGIGIQAHMTPPIDPRNDDFATFRVLFDFAKSQDGLNKWTTEAETWAREHVSRFSPNDFAFFRTLFQFAKHDTGLNKWTTEAEQWAKSNIGYFRNNDFLVFKRLFEFAKDESGLNKWTTEAEQWARAKIPFFMTHDFDVFIERFTFAKSRDGLNKWTSEAETWAMTQIT